MNRKNLKRMADYIRTIPQSRFNMKFYGSDFEMIPECHSVGCAIGHCSVFATKKDLNKYNICNEFDFVAWSEKFTGLKAGLKKWSWCFAGSWNEIDNTPEGAVKRIEWLLNYGLPDDYIEQQNGTKPLCYNSVPTQKILSIGYTGEKRCYLNVSEDEAIKRYAESEGYTIDYVKINFEVNTLEIKDEFGVYEIYEIYDN